MIKLQDFAAGCGVTDRQIQRLIKKYESEIEGHFERKGPNGTWLDEEACQILRSKMKVKEVVLEDKRVNDLLQQIKELQDRIEKKDVIIERLQERESIKDNRISELEKIKLQLEGSRAEEVAAAVTEAVSEANKQAEKAKEDALREKARELNQQAEIERIKAREDAARAAKEEKDKEYEPVLQELDKAKKELERPLTFWERLTGKRKVGGENQ